MDEGAGVRAVLLLDLPHPAAQRILRVHEVFGVGVGLALEDEALRLRGTEAGVVVAQDDVAHRPLGQSVRVDELSTQDGLDEPQLVAGEGRSPEGPTGRTPAGVDEDGVVAHGASNPHDRFCPQ